MSYDINFWKQSPSVKSSPEAIYTKLCEGKRVRGLAQLPVLEILQRLQAELPGFDPEQEFPLVSLENGSIEIGWSDQHFRFDLRGHVPEITRDKLIALMAEFECPLYDPQLDERYELGATGPAGSRTAKTSFTPPNLNEIIEQLAEETNIEWSGPPPRISLRSAENLNFADEAWIADLTKQAEACGYEQAGDYFVPEFATIFRVLYGTPNVFVCLFQHALGISWSEIIVFNADDTTESWCSQSLDDVVPPWATRVVKQAPLLDLHDMMRAGHSGKSPAHFSPGDFPTVFLRECIRGMHWRQNLAAAK